MLNDFMIADVLDKDFEQDFLVWKTFHKDPKLVIRCLIFIFCRCHFNFIIISFGLFSLLSGGQF